MENKDFTVGFSTQKGGMGKTTYTVLVANILHYRFGVDVSVIDADYPQWSIHNLRERELKIIEVSDYYKLKLISQFKQTSRKMWPIAKCSPEDVAGLLKADKRLTDTPKVTFVDLPGSINSDGMLTTIAAMDYIFIPLKADKIVMESSLAFAYMLRENIVGKPACNLKGVYLFWIMIDKREKTPLYAQYEKAIGELGLPILTTCIPLRTKFNKEITENPSPIYRSTVFMPESRFTAEAKLDELAMEIMGILK